MCARAEVFFDQREKTGNRRVGVGFIFDARNLNL